MQRLTGKRALIIGAAAADNMGQHLARRLAAEGAEVMVSGRHRTALASLAQDIDGRSAWCDITDPAAIRSLAAEVKECWGAPDIVINSTGWGLLKPFELTTEEELERITRLQFVGPFLFFQALVQLMRERGQGGSLIQISSATATLMLEHHAAYMGTKAGFDHVMRCLANEYGQYGIRANSIAPGFTRTPMTAGAAAVPGLLELYAQCVPLGRVGTPEDIAEAAVWLASDGCFMSGQTLQVNGGLTLRRNPTLAEMDEAALCAGGQRRPRPWEEGMLHQDEKSP